MLASQIPQTGSNLDLHPTPVDPSIFEDSDDAQYSRSMQAAHNGQTYNPPSASEVVGRILRQGGRRITPAQLSQARTTLDQFHALHGGNASELGAPNASYMSAAYAAFTFGKPKEAFEWLQAIPSYDSALENTERTEMVDMLGLTLNMLKARASIRPEALRACIMSSVSKQWHAEQGIDRKLLGCVKDLLHTLNGHGDINQFWLTLLAASREADLSLAGEEGPSRTIRQVFLRDAYNACVRHLALSPSQLSAAVEMVQQTLVSVRDAYDRRDIHSVLPWVSPPLSFFTYKFLLERLVATREEKNLFTAHALNNEIRSLSYLLPRSRKPLHNSPQALDISDEKKRVIHGWDRRQAVSLQVIGTKLLAETPEIITAANKRHLRSRKQREPRLEPLTLESRLLALSDEVILTHIEAGSLVEARAILLQKIATGQKTAANAHKHLPSAQCLAAYQNLLAPGESNQLSKPLPVARDEEAERALLASRGGSGLWQTAHLWRLQKQGRFQEGLKYYMAHWHTTADFSQRLIREALGSPSLQSYDIFGPAVETAQSEENATAAHLNAQEDHSSVTKLLWPSSHTLTIAIRTLVAQLRDSSSTERDDFTREERLHAAATKLEKLERCWKLWYGAVCQQHIEGTLVDRRLSSRAFDPWIAAFAAALTKLAALQTEVAATADTGFIHSVCQRANVAAQIDALNIFRGFELEFEDQCDVSPASARVLKLLECMQNVNVAPSEATLGIVLDTLARDAIHVSSRIARQAGHERSYNRSQLHGAGVGEPVGTQVAASWSLILHLLGKMGMSDVRAAGQMDRVSAGEISDPQYSSPDLPEGNLATYSALLRGLLAGASKSQQISATSVHQAQQIIRWLAEAVRRGQFPYDAKLGERMVVIDPSEMETHGTIVDLLSTVKEWSAPRASAREPPSINSTSSLDARSDNLRQTHRENRSDGTAGSAARRPDTRRAARLSVSSPSQAPPTSESTLWGF